MPAAQDSLCVAIYSRDGAEWRYRTLDQPDAVLALEASLADIYRDSGA